MRFSRVGLVVGTAAVGFGALQAVGPAHGAVTWSVDTVAASLTLKASAGEPIVVQCVGDRVRTAAGITTTAVCSTLKTLVVTGSAVIDTVDLSGMTTALFPALTSTNVDTNLGDDKITGSPAADTLTGGGGNDRITGGGGDDTINGSSGNDTIGGGAGKDTIAGGSGNDTLAGHTDGATPASDGADDSVNGGPGSDTISAFDGDRISNPATDAAPDTVKWAFTWAVKSFGVESTSDKVDIKADQAAKWSLAPGNICVCTALRAKNIATGVNKGVDVTSPTSIGLSAGNDVFIVSYADPLLLPKSALALDGAAGADELRIVVKDPALVTITANTITFAGAAPVTYTNFENIRTVLG